jgi:hypothetical protein
MIVSSHSGHFARNDLIGIIRSEILKKLLNLSVFGLKSYDKDQIAVSLGILADYLLLEIVD